MALQHIRMACWPVLRYLLAAAGTFGFLMLLPPAPFLKQAPEPFLEALFAGLATAGAFVTVLGVSHLVGDRPNRRWHLHVPLVLWLVLTAAAVALGTLVPIPVVWPEAASDGLYPPVSGVLNLIFAATLMPPLTFWVLLSALRRIR